MPKNKEKHKEITAEEFALRAGCSLEEVMESLRTRKLQGRVILFVEWRYVAEVYENLTAGFCNVVLSSKALLRLITENSGASPRRLHLIREEYLEPFMKARHKDKILGMPEEVRTAWGATLSEEAIEEFWITKNPLLGYNSPKTLWMFGEREKVLDFIKKVNSTS